MPNNTVVGTDGHSPIYQPEGRWCFWSIHELWIGQAGSNKYVPKVNDYVIDPDTYTTYIVDHLDNITLIPTLREIRPANMSFSFSETDVLFGVGPGNPPDTYRVYLDKSVTPYIMAVDTRVFIPGSMANYVRIFKGADVSQTGLVISKVYDTNNILISENVPLELAVIDSHTNYSVKTIPTCSCLHDLQDGEIVTVVVYTANGHVVMKKQLLVENTSFIRSVNISTKYVTHIGLNTAFMSQTNNHLIQFPLNVPINALNITGTVYYSDGSSVTLPVDGNKFKLLGIDQYVSTIVGQKIDLVLSYALSSNEVAYTGVTSDGHYITEPYSLETTNPNNSYAVKLFGYPFWIDQANGYEMRWWMFNLDRNIFFEVTPYVNYALSTGPYNPKAYGILQRKSVSLNLNNVSGAFKTFIHTQLVDIVLNGEPDNSVNNSWTMSHEVISNRPSFGPGLKAVKLAGNSFKIDSGINNIDMWLEKIYYNTYPLINGVNELQPPTPTHFIVNYNNTELEYPITNWNSILNLGVNIPVNKTITVRFVKKVSSTVIELAIAALIVKAI